MSTYTFTARRQGAITLHVESVACDVEIVGAAHLDRAVVELHTDATDGPLVDHLLRLRPAELGDLMAFDLKGLPSVFSGSQGGGVQVGNNNVMFNNFAGGSFAGSGNGQTATASRDAVRVVARVPFGSTALVESVSGDAVIRDVPLAYFHSVSGDVDARGLVFDSSFETVSGHVIVGAAEGASPSVTVKTVSGDLMVCGPSVNSTFRTVSGNQRSY